MKIKKYVYCLLSVLLVSSALYAQLASDNRAVQIRNIVKQDDVNLLNRLIDEGLDLNDKNRAGNNLLMLAAKYGSINVVKTLVEEKNYDELDIQNYAGETALILAAYNGHTEVVDILV